MFKQTDFRMKKFILGCVIVLCNALVLHAQDEKDKGVIKIDLENGLINGLKPTSSAADIKKALPFFTGETEENKGINCDGGVFYGDNDVYFYTARDYVEIRSDFKGKFSKDILNINFKKALAILGNPKHEIKPKGDDESIMVAYFPMPYGCLRLNYTLATGNVFEMAIHSKPLEKAILDQCF